MSTVDRVARRSTSVALAPFEGPAPKSDAVRRMVSASTLALATALALACGPAATSTPEAAPPPQAASAPQRPEPPPVASPSAAPEPAASAPTPASATATAPAGSTAPANGCPAGMVRIEGATFQMGSNDGEPDEKPVHDVTLAAYCIDAREVTVAQYRRCVDAHKCVAQSTAEWRGISDKDKEFRSQSCNGARTDRDEHPMNCVDWRQSNAYCAWVGKRLPTEEEWEYAARGKDGRAFPWGNDAPSAKLLNACGNECVAWAKAQGLTWKPMFDGDDGYATTAPVGSFAAGQSPFGVDDLAGNVAEWTASGYSQDYGRARNDVMRVLRGGSARSETPKLVRAANRHKNVATDRLGGIGFRCAK